MPSATATRALWSRSISCVVPLIAVVGWMFFGESVDALVFVGAGIILAGILWNLRAEAKSGTQNVSLPEDEGLPEPRK